MCNFASVMKKLFALVPAVAMVLASCSKDEGFKVTVDAPEIGTQPILVVYTTADGNRRSLSMPSVDGKFEFEARASEPSIVEIFTSNKQLYAALIAEDGEHLHLTADASGKRVDGSSRSQQLLDYKPGDDISALPAEVREAIELIYIESPRTDWPVFPAAELVMGRDSVKTFEPEGVWVFTSSINQRTSTVLDTLRFYARKGQKRPLRDVFIDPDTSLWRMAIRGDSASWTQGVLPDAPIIYEGILTSLPLLVEVDSAGTVVRTQRLE